MKRFAEADDELKHARALSLTKGSPDHPEIFSVDLALMGNALSQAKPITGDLTIRLMKRVNATFGLRSLVTVSLYSRIFDPNQHDKTGLVPGENLLLASRLMAEVLTENQDNEDRTVLSRLPSCQRLQARVLAILADFNSPPPD